MKTNAYAKINLVLDLTGVLPDGYHAISTVMQSVSLHDTVCVETDGEDGIKLSCSEPGIPVDSRNTAYKAASLFIERAGVKSGVKIHIEKRIPHEAGLGGGSADAAAVLRLMNALHPGKINEAELMEIALKVGADVPFCVKGGTALCLNKGEVMAPLPEFNSWCVIVKPDEGVSTAKAFVAFDNAVKPLRPDMNRFVYYAARGEYDTALSGAFNVFEPVADIAAGSRIKKLLTDNGAFFASMSGSGSAFYGLFADRTYAEAASELLGKEFGFACVCETAGSLTL